MANPPTVEKAEGLTPEEDFTPDVESLHGQLNHYKQLIQKNPNNIDAHFQLGLVYMQSQDFELALQAFQNVIRKDWNYKTVNLQRANCYEQLGFFDRAISALEDLARKEQDPEILKRLGNLWWQKNELFNAAQCLGLSLKHKPEQPETWYDLSRVYYFNQQFEEGTEAIEQALEHAADNTKFLVQQGLVLCAKQDYHRGLLAYQKALELGNEGLELLVNLGNCYTHLKRLSEAESFYRRALQLDNRQPEVLFNLAEFLFLHSPKAQLEAQQLFQQVLELNPKDADAWSYVALLTANNPRQSMDCWQKALDNGFSKIKAWPYLANLHEQMGQHKEMFTIRQKLAEKNPYHSENNYRYGWLLMQRDQKEKSWQYLQTVKYIEPEDTEKWWRLAQSFRLDKNYTAEVHCIQLLLTQQKEEPSLWTRLSEIALDNQFPLKAYEYIGKVAGQVPSDLRFWQYLAQSLLEQGKFSQAIDCVTNFEKAAVYSAKVWRPLVKAFKRHDQLELLVQSLKFSHNQAIIAFSKSLESLKCFDLAEQLYKKQMIADPEIVLAWSQNLAAQKLFVQAQQKLEQALALAANPTILNGLADVYMQQKDYLKAREYCEQALQMNQDDHRIWLNLGILDVRQNNLPLALKHYEKSITLYAHESRSWYGHGAVLVKLERNEEAERSLQKAVGLNRQQHAAWNLLGSLYYQGQQWAKAKHAFLRSLAVSKNQTTAWKNLATVFQVLKQPQKKAACLKQWRELSNP